MGYRRLEAGPFEVGVDHNSGDITLQARQCLLIGQLEAHQPIPYCQKKKASGRGQCRFRTQIQIRGQKLGRAYGNQNNSFMVYHLRTNVETLESNVIDGTVITSKRNRSWPQVDAQIVLITRPKIRSPRFCEIPDLNRPFHRPDKASALQMAFRDAELPSILRMYVRAPSTPNIKRQRRSRPCIARGGLQKQRQGGKYMLNAPSYGGIVGATIEREME